MTRAGGFGFALCLGLVLSSFAGAAHAQRVVLLRPVASDEALLSALAHLQGELTVHHFTLLVVDTQRGGPENELEQAARQAQAVVSIALVHADGLVSAEVWVSDERGKKTLRKTVTTVPRPEGPSVLAVRVVDFVRASLRELSAAATPAFATKVAPSTPASEPMPGTASGAADRKRFAVEGAALLQGSAGGVRLAYGPSLALGYDILRSWALRLVFQLPLRGARYTHGAASATLAQEQLMAELRFRVYARGPFSLSLLGDAGVQHIAVKGRASPPYRARSDSAWTALFAAGLGGEWRFLPALALSLRARCLVLVPRPVIHVADESVPLGRPFFQLAGGIDVAF